MSVYPDAAVKELNEPLQKCLYLIRITNEAFKEQTSFELFAGPVCFDSLSM